MKNLTSVDIDNLLSGVSGLNKINMLAMLKEDNLNELMATQTDGAVNIFINEVLYKSDVLASLLLTIKGSMEKKGYSHYLVEYDYDKAGSYFLDDHLSRSFLPKNIWFVHDKYYDIVKYNLEDAVRLSSYKNIHDIVGCDDEILSRTKLPMVTLAITNYNYENYLTECVQSILDLNYPYLQTIIVDDCSTDGSAKILEKYKDRFEIIRHEKNKGQLAGFFSAVDVAVGDFIVFVDADDMLDFNAINVHLSVHLYSKPYVAFTCGRNRQMSADSAILSDYHLDLATHSEKIKYIKPRFLHSPTWSWSTTSAMMFRIDMLRLIKTQNTDAFRICADYYIVNFSNLLGASMLIDTAISSYRRHGKNNFSKNFIVGGHKPTGHLKYHSHPEHWILIDEIVSKLLNERDKIEPYFGSMAHFGTVLSFAMPVDELLKIDSLPEDIVRFLRSNKGKINMELRKYKFKLFFRMWYAKKSCFLKSLRSFDEFFNKTYCEK